MSLPPRLPTNNENLPTRSSLEQPNGKDICRSDILGKLSKEYAKLSTVRNLRSQDLSSVNCNSCSWNKADEERVILVSRKLPYHFTQGDDQVWRAEPAPNNQALRNLCTVHSRQRSLWIGLSGVEVELGTQRLLVEMLRHNRMLPIFLNQSLLEKFHTGFCRSVLWPLCHSAMPTMGDMIARHDAEGDGSEAIGGEVDMWQAYKAVNQHFADHIQSVYQDGDLIWVQDYHFMLVPRMLRHVLPNAKISFFLHLPFPSSEIYRVLPYREEILEGIVAADIIGFQTYDYARHFLSTIESLLEATCSPKGVEYYGHFAHVAICPVGIIPEHWTTMATSDEVKSLMERWWGVFRGRRVLLGVDGLDPTKGLIHKLLAVEEMFEQNQKLAETVTFVQVCFTESASAMGDVDILVSQIHAMSAQINSKLASAGEEGPFKVFMDINSQELCAMYCIADVLVVTPLRDGMNIIPFEYSICRGSHGRLATVVLSEFAGCARSLGGALLVNPWSTFELAEIMQTAMDMDEEERAIRHSNMIHYIRNFTSESWSQSSMADLKEAKEGGNRTTSWLLPDDHIVQTYDLVSWRLLIFSLERVLMKETSLPELLSIPEEVVESLSELSLCPTNMVVVKSRRTREVLEKLLGHTNCVLAAECGAFVKWGHHSDWENLCPSVLLSAATTRAVVEPVLQYYTERTPGSVIEIREASIAWHYNDCDIGHGEWQAKQLHVSLLASKGAHLSVFYGDKVLEVMPQGLCTAGEMFLGTVIGRMRQLLKAHDTASNGFFGARDVQGMRLLNQWTPRSLVQTGGFFKKSHSMIRGGGVDTGGDGMDITSGELVKDMTQPTDGQRIWPFVEVEVVGEETGLKSQVTCMIREAPIEWEEAKGIFYIDRAALNEEIRTQGRWQSEGIERQHVPHKSAPRLSYSSHGENIGLSLCSTAESESSCSTDIEFMLVVASGQEFNDEHIFGSISAELGLDLKDFVECVEELGADEEDTCEIMMADGNGHGAPHPHSPDKGLKVPDEGKESEQDGLTGREWPDNNSEIVSSSPLLNSPTKESNRTSRSNYEIEHLKNQLQKAQQYTISGTTNSKPGERRDDTIGPRQAAIDSRVLENDGRMLMDENAAPAACSNTIESTVTTDRPSTNNEDHNQALTKVDAAGSSNSNNNTMTHHGISPMNYHQPQAYQDSVVVEDSNNNDLFHDGLNRMKLRNTASQRAEIIAQSQFRPRQNFPPKTVLFQAMKEKLPSNCSHHVIPDTAAACWAMVLSTQQDGKPESWREMQNIDVVQETSLNDTSTTRDEEKLQQENGDWGPRISQYQLGHLEKSFSKANLIKAIQHEKQPQMMDDHQYYDSSPPSTVDTRITGENEKMQPNHRFLHSNIYFHTMPHDTHTPLTPNFNGYTQMKCHLYWNNHP